MAISTSNASTTPAAEGAADFRQPHLLEQTPNEFADAVLEVGGDGR